MPKSIPWEVAQRVAEEQGCRQIILMGWDGEQVHVVTYGVTADDSDQAAMGGNYVKKALGWPKRLCEDESPKVKQLREVIEILNEKIGALNDIIAGSQGEIRTAEGGPG